MYIELFKNVINELLNNEINYLPPKRKSIVQTAVAISLCGQNSFLRYMSLTNQDTVIILDPQIHTTKKTAVGGERDIDLVDIHRAVSVIANVRVAISPFGLHFYKIDQYIEQESIIWN